MQGRKFAPYLIFSLLLSVYAASFTGTFRVDDEHILASRAQSFALWGTFEEPQVYGNQRIQELIPLGPQATQIEPGQTLLGGLFYRIARLLDLGGAQALFNVNLLATALTGVIVFLTAVSLGYSVSTGIWCSILFGLGSIVWPYSTTFYRDSLAMLFSSLVFLGLARLWHEGRARLLSGVILIFFGMTAGVLTKSILMVFFPVLLIVLAYFGQSERLPRKSFVYAVTGVFILIAALIFFTMTISEDGPLARYTWPYYRFLAGFFSQSIGAGLVPGVLGPFLSPSKSILLFSPPLILSILGLRKGWARHRVFLVSGLSFTVLLAVAQGLFYRENWAGTFGWGLRYMLPALPPLIVLSAPVVDKYSDAKPGWGKWVLPIVLGFGVVVQLSGIFVRWETVYLDWQAQGLNPYSQQASWDPRFLAIPSHLVRIIPLTDTPVVWIKLLMAGSLLALVIPATSLVFGMLSITNLRRISHQQRFSWITAKRSVLILVIASLLFPLVLGSWIYRFDPYWGNTRAEFVDSMSYVSDRATGRDVLVIDSYGTPLWTFWTNQWEGLQRWYSLPFEIPGVNQDPSITKEPGPPAMETVRLFEELPTEYDRLWYLTSDEAPDYGLFREQDWLEGRFEKQDEKVFVGERQVDVYLFDLGSSLENQD